MTTTTVLDFEGLNTVILVGEITSPQVLRTLSNGNIASSFDLATATADGRLSVPVSMNGESDVAVVGALVCVLGSVRRRFFRAGGSVTSRTEVIATAVIPLRRKAQIRKALEGPIENLLALQGG
jgi:single-stranded DNA-binding protein